MTLPIHDTAVAALSAPTSWHRRAPERLRQVLLVGLALATGCVDALSWLVLGKIFSAFMTGNLVFLGLTAGGGQGPDAGQAGLALVTFGLGAAVGGRVTASVRKRQGWWPLPVSIALGLTAVLEGGALCVWKASDADPSGTAVSGLIGMLAAAMGIQTVAIASLGVRGIFTTAATATLAMFMGDAAGWPHVKGEAGRLVAVVVGVVAGAAAGAFLIDHAPMSAPLFPAIVTIVVIAVGELLIGDRSRHGSRFQRSPIAGISGGN